MYNIVSFLKEYKIVSYLPSKKYIVSYLPQIISTPHDNKSCNVLVPTEYKNCT